MASAFKLGARAVQLVPVTSVNWDGVTGLDWRLKAYRDVGGSFIGLQ